MAPTILLTTGAWHIPEHYEALISKLRAKGFVVECPRLKTNNTAAFPDATVNDDVKQIRDLALKLLQTGDLVVLMHSYGGIVGSNALSNLPKTKGILELIYMAAFLPLEGDSLAGIFGGALPPWLTPNEKGFIDIDDPQTHFYSDLSKEDQDRFTGMLVPHPTAAQYDAPNPSSASPAWKTEPTTYLVCRGDQGLPEAVQEMMLDRTDKAGGKIKREYCDASHSPFLSMPETVVGLVEKVAGKY